MRNGNPSRNGPALHVAVVFTLLSPAACTPAIADTVLDAFAGSFGETVTVAEYDATPPTVTLEIPDLGSGPIVVGEGGASVTIDLELGQVFFVLGVAEDPEGVKSVGFFGSSTRFCHSPGSEIGTTTFATLIGPNSVDDAAAGESAFTRRWQPTLITDAYGCASGQVGYYHVTLGVRAQNFSGLEATTSGASSGYTFED